MTDRAIIANADSRRLPLGDGSVHMIATSPPYWGLRDYGTAKWEGGAPECDHTDKTIRPSNQSTLSRHGENGRSPYLDNAPAIQYRDTCPKCGAIRIDNQLGLERGHDCLAWARGDEPCGACYVCHLREWAREMWRVLRDDGCMFLNLGDSYAGGGFGSWEDGETRRGYGGTNVNKGKAHRNTPGLKPKDLVGIPWRVALALQADGWYLRSDIIWAKPNPMPESVTDRPTKSHEYIFLLTKSARYFWDGEAVKEGGTGRSAGNNGHVKGAGNGDPFFRTREGFASVADVEWHTRNLRTVWNVATQPYSGAHFATWPEALVETMVKAGTSERGVCPVCGKPWERVVERGESSWERRKADGAPMRYGTDSPALYTGFTNEADRRAGGLGVPAKKTTTGHRPACDHDAAPVPAVVLDPFAGSGTTLLVARRLGRIGLGFDLSLAYLRECAAERLGHNLLRQWGRGIRDNGNHATLPLFAMEAQ